MEKKKELIRFIIVGLLATGIHYGIYLFLMRWLQVNWAYSIGYAISFLFNFYSSARFTFKSNASVKKGVGFGLSHLVNYGLHLFLLNLFLKIKIPPSVAPIPVFALAIPINFLLVRFVFTSKKFQS